MAPTLTKTPATKGNVEAAAQAIRMEEAKKAQRLGQYSEGIEARARALMSEKNEVPGAAQEKSSEQIAAMNVDERRELADVLNDNATKAAATTQKFDDLKVGHSLSGTNTMGQAHVGQGRRSIEMNGDLLVEAHTEKGKEKLRDTGAHELSHAEDQGGVIGPLKVGNKDVKKGDVNEAKSEFAGGNEVGRGEAEHRANQPQDYTDAQDSGIAVKKAVGEAEFNQLTEEGDTLKLQQRIWREQLKKGANFADVLREGAELDQVEQRGYHTAAHEVVTDHITSSAAGTFAGMNME